MKHLYPQQSKTKYDPVSHMRFKKQMRDEAGRISNVLNGKIKNGPHDSFYSLGVLIKKTRTHC